MLLSELVEFRRLNAVMMEMTPQAAGKFGLDICHDSDKLDIELWVKVFQPAIILRCASIW